MRCQQNAVTHISMSLLEPELSTTAQKLVRAVSVTAARHGVGGLSSRTLADEAGVSASAINYTFGSIDRLLDAAHPQADALFCAHWDHERGELEDITHSAADLGATLFLASRRLATRYRGEQALFWARVIRAARVGDTAPFTEGLSSERAYWRDVLERAGLAGVDTALVHSFSLAIRFAYHACGQPERFDPWAMVLAQRLASRLCGQAPTTAEDSAYRQRAENRASLSDEARVHHHGTARQIIETAVETILEGGAELATFREIAKRSGISVSSVQHFFGSRRAYLMAAYQAIYARVRDRTVGNTPPRRSLSAGQLSSYLADRNPTPHHREFAAMQGLMLSASHDDETRILVEGLLARTGQTSLHLLHALARPRGAISRLDAQIFSLIMTHLVTLEICGQIRPPETRALDELVHELLKAAFAMPEHEARP